MTRAVAGAVAIVLLSAAAAAAVAQTLYKSRGPDGEWIYADRPPPDGKVEEIRELGRAPARGSVTVQTVDGAGSVRFVAANGYEAPIELSLRFRRIGGLSYPDPDQRLVWVLPPKSRTDLLALDKLGDAAPNAQYEYEYVAGDPGARHRPDSLYRVPFATASNFPVTQAYPDVVTHRTPDSRYAIDIAMPIGTDIFAARDGIVFDVSSENFRGGLDPERDGPAANVVQILHDDGTYALYAHLNWNSIRVRPGDRVARGQYIADSGNTGFSSGPHLHFAVLRNAGMRLESVPVRFEGADSTAVVPATGAVLRAY